MRVIKVPFLSAVFTAGLSLCNLSLVAESSDLEFIEQYAIGNREEALKRLPPGSNEYYYYYCLYHQTRGELEKSEEYFKEWSQKNIRSGKFTEIENRQALLNYKKDPQKTLQFLKDKLKPNLHHSRIEPDKKYTYPTSLNNKLISLESLLKNELKRDPHSVKRYITDRGLDFISSALMNEKQRRSYLNTVSRPDHPELVDMILGDLDTRGSRGFGSLKIHNNLTLKQLDQLAEKRPGLLSKQAFFKNYIQRLVPADGADLDDTGVRRQYLLKLLEFSKKLPKSFTSFKVQTIYFLLELNLDEGKFDENLFYEYVKLPRNVNNQSWEYRKKFEYEERANLRYNCGHPFMKTISEDFALVRAHLLHFLAKSADWKKYEPYMTDTFLKPIFAEAKLTAGVGDKSDWAKYLTSEQYEALQMRVDLDFERSNKKFFASSEDVVLKVNMKNTTKVFAKVYRINSYNYYTKFEEEPNLDLDLEGLVPNVEKTFEYSEHPLKRVTRNFEFPELKKRGIYVVDFIGNGKTCRALIKKGRLRHVVQTAPGAQVFRILNDKNEPEFVKNGSIFLNGKEYKSDENGLIFLPLSNEPGNRQVILSDGETFSMAEFYHQAENYSLTASFHVNRENLLKNRRGSVIIRPKLVLNGQKVSSQKIECLTLTVVAKDQDNVESRQTVALKCTDDSEILHTFKVPAHLRKVDFRLEATVRNLSKNRDDKLSASDSISVNSIDDSTQIRQIFMGREDNGYFLQMTGKNGEKIANKPVQVLLHSTVIKPSGDCQLQTDGKGKISLGELKFIDFIEVSGTGFASQRFYPYKPEVTLPQMVFAEESKELSLPYTTRNLKGVFHNFVLVEKRNGQTIRLLTDRVKYEQNAVKISALEEGRYLLSFKDSGKSLNIWVRKAKKVKNYLVKKNEIVELKRPLSTLQSIKKSDKKVEIKVGNPVKGSRVQLVASRFMPHSTLNSLMENYRNPDSFDSLYPQSLYDSGKSISDEFNYILKRRYAEKYVGNMLERPGLLLNPYNRNETASSDTGIAMAGDAFGLIDRRKPFVKYSGKAKSTSVKPYLGLNSTYDFLAQQSVVLANVEVPRSGEISIPLAELKGKQLVEILLVTPDSSVYRQIHLPLQKMKRYDNSLVNALNPDKHFIESWGQDVVNTGEKFVIDNITTTKFEIYDELADVWRVLRTLSENSVMDEFSFVPKWDEMKEEEKLEKYSKYACHELNYFIYCRDQEFFEKHVKSYLENKREKTFLDNWLLKHDVSEYGKVRYFEPILNTFEKVLYGARVKDEPTKRYIREQFELITPNPEYLNFLYSTATAGSALEESGIGFETDKMRQKLNKLQAELKRYPDEPGIVIPKIVDSAPASADEFEDDFDEEFEESLDVEKPSPIVAKKGVVPPAPVIEEEEGGWGDDADDEGSWDEEDEFDDTAASITLSLKHKVERLYQVLPPTVELAENDYYKLSKAQQDRFLIQTNAFWQDFSVSKAKPVLSANFLHGHSNFSEVMTALASLKIPAKAMEHKTDFDRERLTLTAKSPLVIFHKQIRPTPADGIDSELIVKQNYFDEKDRYRHENNRRIEKNLKPVSKGEIEMLKGHIYGCRVIFTNPTAVMREFDVLQQIPAGALPVKRGFYTKSRHVKLGAYSTTTFEYLFYFPKTGKYGHFPVHVAENQKLAAFANKYQIKVVEKLSKVDKTSWHWLSQYGSEEDIFTRLEKDNFRKLKLDLLAFRLKDKEFFKKLTGLMGKNHIYSDTIWAYAVSHNDKQRLAEWLQKKEHFFYSLGRSFESELVKVQPVLDRLYQHLDYDPLIHARAHVLKERREILNHQLKNQYISFLKTVAYGNSLSAEEKLSACYYLLLQDRITEAIEFFTKVRRAEIAEKVQYDYMAAYLGFYKENLAESRRIADKYKKFSIARWRNRFLNVIKHLDEAEGKEVAKSADDESRETLTDLAVSEPSIELLLENNKLTVSTYNLDSVTVNYYLMDVELLFSKSPFMEKSGRSNALFIEPNFSQKVALKSSDKGKYGKTIELPADVLSKNCRIEVKGRGIAETIAYFANELNVKVERQYGQVKVTDKTNKPLRKVYVKAYAKMGDGTVHFYHDGYTDIRGRFDYASVSTLPAGYSFEYIQDFAVLILSEKHGAVIKEVQAPQR